MSFVTRTAAVILLPAALWAQAPASSYGSGSTQAPPANHTATTITPGVNLFESNSSLEMANRLFDSNSDAIDFENGTFEWKGRTFNMGSNRALRGRFERYLSNSASTDAEAYQAILDEVYHRLAVNTQGDIEENVFDAWSLLFQAAEYEMDANNSLVIANQVFNAWRVRREHYSQQLSAADMERQRKLQQSIVANRTAMAERDVINKRKRGDDGGEKGNARPTSTQKGEDGKNLEMPTEADFRMMDLVETEKNLLLVETQMASSAMQAKLQFQSQIVTFLLQRRFEHALIASAFYRQIFRGSAQNLEVGKAQMAEFLPASDMSFTVETLEFLAREAQADVRSGMDSTRNALERGHVLTAIERMQETFFLGEYTREVMTFDEDARLRLLNAYRAISDARRMMDMKDYESVERVVTELEKDAKDFPASQILSAVRSAQRLSDLSLLSAQQAIGVKDFERAEIAIQRATEIWPLNPRIREYTEEMADRANIGSQASRLFDELYKNANHRQLYERSAELGIALMSDPERSAKLRESVEKIGKIDVLIAQSKELVAQNNPYAAWDMLVSASKVDPDDVVVNREIGRLAPSVADYVGLLNRAERQENENRHAASLSLYLAAQEIHPGSQICRLGIERVSKALMSSMRSETETPAGDNLTGTL